MNWNRTWAAGSGAGSVSISTPGSSFSEGDLMPAWGYAAAATVLFFIGFFGFFLNLMAIILMYRDKQLWTPLNLILFNLVCSDFSVSVLGNPFTLMSAIAHRWIFGHTMCVVYGFFMTLLGITSITTLTVLSFERYLLVSRPLSSRHLTMRGAGISICLIWLYSILVCTPPLYGWGRFVNEAANISCSINWEEQTLNALTYIMFLFATGLVLPVIVIAYSYCNILRTMKKNSLRMGKVTRAESRVTMMVLVMILTFMMAWTPYSVLALIEQFAKHDMVSPGLGVIPALVAKSSICYDPIIYVGMNTQFRASLKRLFGLSSRDDDHEQGIDNTVMSPSRAPSQAIGHDSRRGTRVALVLYRQPAVDTSGLLLKDSAGEESSDLSAEGPKSPESKAQKMNAANDSLFFQKHKSTKNDSETQESDSSLVDQGQILVIEDLNAGVDNPASDIWGDTQDLSLPVLLNCHMQRDSPRRKTVADLQLKKELETMVKKNRGRKLSAGGPRGQVGRLLVDEREQLKEVFSHQQ